MKKLNEKKFTLYANKLYRGELQRYKKKLEKENDMFSVNSFFKEENKIKRIAPSPSQMKDVARTCKNKCQICSEPYLDKDDFQFHHINGDRSKTTTTNLVLICNGCHRKVHTRVKSKLKDYKVGKKNKGTSDSYDIPDIKIPKIPKFKW